MPSPSPQNKRGLPLKGLKVLDLTRVLAGPYATMILADLGAQVVKVEEPPQGDEARGVGPFFPQAPHISAYFYSINRNKKSITLNLKAKEDKEKFLALAARADILVENFLPATMQKLGLDYKKLSVSNPRLIYAACSGFGQEGPYAQKRAYDLIVQGMGGIMSITGEPQGPPVRVGTSLGDIAASLYLVIGILAALHRRKTTGQGAYIDVAMLDCQVAILENAVIRHLVTGEIPTPLGGRHPSIAPFDVFPAADGPFILAVGTKQWERFCRFIGRPELITDERFATNARRNENYHLLQPVLAAITKTKAVKEWLAQLEAIGVPAGPINRLEEVVADPQVLFRQMIVTLEDEKLGTVKMAGSPIKIRDIETQYTPAPDLGRHTQEVLKSWLGED